MATAEHLRSQSRTNGFPRAVYMARILDFEDTIYRHPNRITPGYYLAKSRFELAQN